MPSYLAPDGQWIATPRSDIGLGTPVVEGRARNIHRHRSLGKFPFTQADRCRRCERLIPLSAIHGCLSKTTHKSRCICPHGLTARRQGSHSDERERLWIQRADYGYGSAEIFTVCNTNSRSSAFFLFTPPLFLKNPLPSLIPTRLNLVPCLGRPWDVIQVLHDSLHV